MGDSPLALTWTMVSFAAPLTFVSPIAGALADRIPRRHMVIFSQTGNVVMTLILAGLDMAGSVHLWHLIVIGMASGSLMALEHAQPAGDALGSGPRA
jgi:MFS family permease